MRFCEQNTDNLGADMRTGTLMTGRAACREETTCRLCSSTRLDLVISLGMQPLANALPQMDEKVEVFPLNLVRCCDCGLVQIRETIAPELLFRNYLYFSSYADTLVKNARILSERISEDGYARADELIVEVGSNDGYLLQFYKDRGMRVLGVEPAENVASHAVEKRGVPTMVAFFDESVAQAIRDQHGPAKIIHAHNVLAHTARLHSVMEGIAKLLDRDGILVAEVQYFKDMADMASFDMIYHEHLCYYTLDTFQRMLGGHGLRAFHVEHLETHGGSLRIFACKGDRYPQVDTVQELMVRERQAGTLERPFYRDYAGRVARSKESILGLLHSLRAQGKLVAAYGAAAKATVMFNYFAVDSRMIRYVVDRNPQKQGRYIPGTDLIILPVDAIEQNPPDFLFLSAWNLAEEIVGQLGKFTLNGGKFIVPFPEVKII